MSAKKPMRWSKFWWQDYDRDQGLRGCSLASQGLWMRLLCMMHEAEPYGHLVVNGVVPSNKRLASMIGKPEKEIVAALVELEEYGVFSRNAEGIIYCRRLKRDKEASDAGRAYGITGGNPALKGSDDNKDKPTPGEGGLTPPENPIEAEAKKEKETPCTPPQPADVPRAASPTRTREPKGNRLPEDWRPSEKDRAFAMSLNLNPDEVADEFKAYWLALTGNKAVKAGEKGWSLTYQNRCRDRAAWLARHRGYRRETPSEAVNSAFGPSLFKDRFDLDAQFDAATLEGSHVRVN